MGYKNGNIGQKWVKQVYRNNSNNFLDTPGIV